MGHHLDAISEHSHLSCSRQDIAWISPIIRNFAANLRRFAALALCLELEPTFLKRVIKQIQAFPDFMVLKSSLESAEVILTSHPLLMNSLKSIGQ